MCRFDINIRLAFARHIKKYSKTQQLEWLEHEKLYHQPNKTVKINLQYIFANSEEMQNYDYYCIAVLVCHN